MSAVPVTAEESSSFGITKRLISFGRGSLPDFVPETQVEIHWECRLIGDTVKKHQHSHDSGCNDCSDDNVLDDTRKLFGKNNPMTLVLGRSFRLPCLELCVKTMCLSEVAVFTVTDPKQTAAYPGFASSLRSVSKKEPARSHCCGALAQTVGYGFSDLDDLIRNPCRPLRFTIELCAIRLPGQYAPERWQLSDDDRIASIQKLREEGNRLVSENEWRAAAALYSEALDSLDLLCSRDKPGEPEWQDFDSKKVVFYSNLAQCQLKLDDFTGVVDSCSQVIRRDPHNVKAFFRRARAYSKLWESNLAFADWSEAIKLDSSLSHAIMKEADEYRQLLKFHKKAEAETFKAAFAKLQSPS